MARNASTHVPTHAWRISWAQAIEFAERQFEQYQQQQIN